MYHCKYCTFSSISLRGYVFHFANHRNMYNVKFPCAISECQRFFKNYNSFKCHMLRNHFTVNEKDKISWTCIYCGQTDSTFSAIVSHLRIHIEAGVIINCPFKNCKSTFKNRSSFNSHLHRNHKNKTQLSNTYKSNELLDHFTSDNAMVNSFQAVDAEDNFLDSDPFSAENPGLFEKNLAIFYLKLQSEYFIPSSTIQFIISEFQELQKFGVHHTREKLKEKLSSLAISQSQISEILDVIQQSDLFSFYNSTSLSTNYKRLSYFKTNFKYIAPIRIFLGKNKKNTYSYFQYIPIKDSILNLTSYFDKNVSTFNQNPCKLVDFYDGKLYKNHSFFQSHPDALKIILYQDSFEVVNPLGSAKKAHKVLAMYFTLGNFEPSFRLNIDNIQLVLLCKESDFKYFGQEKVFSRLISDLKDIESTGIRINDGEDQKHVNGTVFSVLGDNLGSHGIGGFIENFTSNFFCRYCLITSKDFHDNPLHVGLSRTSSSYKSAIADGAGTTGIKFDSVLNALEYYHVCSPGLPPCLAHDLFEGVVAYDLALYLQYFIKIQKVFSCEHLNYSIFNFKYKGSDARNKPVEINLSSEKLAGKAAQNWCLLRLLPLILEPFLEKLDENIWSLVLNLKEIVEIICAPTININQVAYLKGLIEDYLDCRRINFPHSKFKPKHHYLLHYPDLTVLFGPLIRMSTLRFESKHSLFKRSARTAHNFKNLCFTLADRHQFRQAYINTGRHCYDSIDADAGTDYDPNTFSTELQKAVEDFHFTAENTCAYNMLSIKGTLYKNGQYVIYKKIEYDLILGKILMIFVKNNLVILAISLQKAILCRKTGCYILNNASLSQIISIKIEDLLDYYPLMSYNLQDNTYISLHHAFYDCQF